MSSSDGNSGKKLEMVISALNSKTRREILKLLIQGPMNLREVFDCLLNEGSKIRYPESVYKGLETLVDCGLVEKYYKREKGLLYKLTSSYVNIDFSEF